MAVALDIFRENVGFNSCSFLSCLFWYVNFLIVETMMITIYVLNLEFHLTFFTFLVFWRYLQLVFGLPISVIRLQFVELDFLIVLECFHFFFICKN